MTNIAVVFQSGKGPPECSRKRFSKALTASEQPADTFLRSGGTMFTRDASRMRL